MRIAIPFSVGVTLAGLLLVGNGCNAHSPGVATEPGPLAHLVPTTRPIDPKMGVALDQIEPRVALPPPATQPAGAGPLEAVQLYAQARAAFIDGDRSHAVDLLERATRLDPGSFELHAALGKALVVGAAANDRAIAEFEKATVLEPDTLELQYELGRQYLAKNDSPRGLERLRLARLTSGYTGDKAYDLALLVDFWLARALQQNGYDRASLDLYDGLLRRIQRPLLSARSNPELLYLVQHPEILYVQVGELYEKNGQYIDALRVYEAAASRDLESFDLASRVVRTRLTAGKVPEAKTAAEAIVLRTHANAESIALLKEVHRRLGSETGYLDALSRLHTANPKDRAVFFALLEGLKVAQRPAEAQRLLAAADAGKFDPEITRKRFALFQEQADIESAMRLLVESLAARPDSLRDVGQLWSELLKPGHRGRLRLPVLQKMAVAPGAEAARLYWVAQLAEIWNRDALAQSAIERAAAVEPAFPPVYRLLVSQYWAKPDWNDAQKVAECQKLVGRVRKQGNEALASELEGRSLFSQNQPGKAAIAFAKAAEQGNRSPDLQLVQGRAWYRDGNEARCEQMLWKLVSDWPQFDEAYSELFGIYIDRRSIDQAAGVLRKWLDNDPSSVDARLLQASVYAQFGRADMVSAAESIVAALVSEQPDNFKVLLQAEAFYTRIGKLGEFAGKLEYERTRNPQNREAVEVLVDIYANQKRVAEASRVLDASRAAVASDPDLLYYVAHLYERIEQKQTTEEILQQVVRLDPRHAAASNDLGYTWADQGKNMERAEALIGVAVEEEPDNQSYLDSMGWVEYKRGKFSEARAFLDRAIGPATRPDPVVLDHMGDVLYRLSRPTEALKEWQWSLKRLDETRVERDDLKQLRLQLMQKIKQHEQGQPVHVAPIVETEVKPATAKN